MMKGDKCEQKMRSCSSGVPRRRNESCEDVPKGIKIQLWIYKAYGSTRERSEKWDNHLRKRA